MQNTPDAVAVKLLHEELDALIKEPGEINQDQFSRTMLTSNKIIVSTVMSNNFRVNAMWPFFQGAKYVILIVVALYIGREFDVYTRLSSMIFPALIP